MTFDQEKILPCHISGKSTWFNEIYVANVTENEFIMTAGAFQGIYGETKCQLYSHFIAHCTQKCPCYEIIYYDLYPKFLVDITLELH